MTKEEILALLDYEIEYQQGEIHKGESHCICLGLLKQSIKHKEKKGTFPYPHQNRFFNDCKHEQYINSEHCFKCGEKLPKDCKHVKPDDFYECDKCNPKQEEVSDEFIEEMVKESKTKERIPLQKVIKDRKEEAEVVIDPRGGNHGWHVNKKGEIVKNKKKPSKAKKGKILISEKTVEELHLEVADSDCSCEYCIPKRKTNV